MSLADIEHFASVASGGQSDHALRQPGVILYRKFQVFIRARGIVHAELLGSLEVGKARAS